MLVVAGKVVIVPAAPGSGNQAGGDGETGPTTVGFLFDVGGAGRDRGYIGRTAKFPLEQGGFQHFAERLRRKQGEQPIMTSPLEGSLGRWSSRMDLGAIFPGDAESVVGGAVIDDQDFVTRAKGLEGPSQAKSVVQSMQDGSDRWHARTGHGNTVRETGQPKTRLLARGSMLTKMKGTARCCARQEEASCLLVVAGRRVHFVAM